VRARLSFGWLRRLLTTVRGTVAAGLARWEHHRGRLRDGSAFTFCLPPFPPPPARPLSERERRARAILEVYRARLEAGVRLAPLVEATKLGAVIHARLEVAVPERWRALLVVEPAESPAPVRPARGAARRAGQSSR
jgi:hypothetical protein